MDSRPPSYTSRAGFARLPNDGNSLDHENTSYPPLSNKRPNPTGQTTAVRHFCYHHRAVLRAAPAALASTLWISMIVYFFVYYTTVLNKVDGHFPRIGPSYSVWPYISCIGAVRLAAFQTFACIIAPLVITAFGLDLWLSRFVLPGRWLRVTKFALAFVSDGFLIALSFESVNSHSHLHLIFTSIQIWCMGAAKVVDDVLNHTMRKYDPANEHLLIAKTWKRAAGFLALLTGPVAVVGIYSCQEPVGLLPETSYCWKMVAWAAPCEWILALCWSAYLYMIAYDLYHAEEVRDSVMAKSGGISSFRLIPRVKLSKVEDAEGDTVPLTGVQPASRMMSRTSFGEVTSYAVVKDQEMMNEEDFLSSSWDERKARASIP